jgi:5-aminolevulinate synthase
LREQHQSRANLLKSLLELNNIEIINNDTHIVPVLVGDAVKCKRISDELINEHNIYVQSINYPTVAVGTERLRFAPTPLHSDAMINDLVDKLRTVL